MLALLKLPSILLDQEFGSHGWTSLYLEDFQLYGLSRWVHGRYGLASHEGVDI